MRIADNIRASELGDEIVLLDLRRGQYFSLDGVGRRFWQLLQAGKSLDHAVSVVTTEYDAPASQVRADLEALTVHLRERDILVD